MITQEVPEPWAHLMRRGDFTRSNGSPNISGLARATGLAVETVRRAIHGIGTPGAETVTALTRELGPEVQELLGFRVDLGVYEPPPESAFLTHRQRKALDEMIRAFVVTARDSIAERAEHERFLRVVTQNSEAEIRQLETEAAQLGISVTTYGDAYGFDFSRARSVLGVQVTRAARSGDPKDVAIQRERNRLVHQTQDDNADDMEPR